MPQYINDDDSENDPDTSNTIYEIVMVAVAAGMMLVCGAVILFLAISRRCNPCGMNYNQHTSGSASTVNVTRNSQDNISTIDLQGPVHIGYINEKSNNAPSEIPIGKVTLSRDALLYISLITCMNLPDNIDSEENL